MYFLIITVGGIKYVVKPNGSLCREKNKDSGFKSESDCYLKQYEYSFYKTEILYERLS